jgi:hypothetical protein
VAAHIYFEKCDKIMTQEESYRIPGLEELQWKSVLQAFKGQYKLN